MDLGMLLVGQLHGRLGAFAVFEQGFVVIDLKSIGNLLIGRVHPGHQAQGENKGHRMDITAKPFFIR